MDTILDIRKRPLRFIAATVAGSIVGTGILLAYVMQFDRADWDAMHIAMNADTAMQAVAATYLVVVLGGVLPTLFIGFALMAFEEYSPLTLVLVPATLFVFILGEMAREMNDMLLPLLVLPAILAGGATMLGVLTGRRHLPARFSTAPD